MRISLASSRANGFQKWSDGHKPIIAHMHRVQQTALVPSNSDANVVTNAATERPRTPWLVPGVGSSL